MKKVSFLCMALLMLLSCNEDTVEPIIASIELTDIEMYYGFDKSNNIYNAIELVQSTTSEKSINSKKISVNSATVVSSDPAKGTFTLNLNGTVNGQSFTKEYQFTGFIEANVENIVVETTDIEAYYNFDRSKTIDIALEVIKNTTSEKNISSKKIQIVEVTILSSDESKGTFSLKASGIVNGKDFVKECEFTGFKTTSISLTDYEIGSRAYAQWKVEESVFLKDFDIDKLLISKDLKFYTTEYLSKFVDFYASSVGGLHRKLTSEEVAGLKIKDFAYSIDNVITFKTEYKGIVNPAGSRLDFNREKHYSTKITIDRNFVSNLYMRGSYYRLNEFLQGFLQYDRNIYAAELENESLYDDSDNTISVNINFMNIKNGETLTSIHKVISGFKPLSDLSNELLFSSSSALELYMKQKALTTKSEEQRNALLKATVGIWTHKMQISIKRSGGYYNLDWDETNANIIGNTKVKDVYLERPIFEFISSTITDNVLYVKLRLSSVNSEVINGAEFDIKIRNI